MEKLEMVQKMKIFKVRLKSKKFKCYIDLKGKKEEGNLLNELEEKTKKAIGKSKFSAKASYGEFKIFDNSNRYFRLDLWNGTLPIQKVIDTFKD